MEPGYSFVEETFEFTGDPEADYKERFRLEKTLRAASFADSRFHLSLQGSHVYSNMPGFSNEGIKWLRCIRGTYSILPKLEAGISTVWFDDVFYYETSQAIGVYLTAVYKPLIPYLPASLHMKIGGGISPAFIDYNFTRNATFFVSGRFFSGYLFGNLSYKILDGLSVGLAFLLVIKARSMTHVNLEWLTYRFGGFHTSS